MYLVCQYLKGSPEGALCSVANELIRNIEDVNIRVCMSRHHEACYYYISSLRSCVTSGTALETP